MDRRAREKYILVADRDKDSREDIILSLSDDYLVRPSPADGQVLMAAEGADLIILDLAGETDLSVVRNIKTARPSLPIICISHKGSGSLILSAFRSGARDFFKKPIDMELLTKCIKGVFTAKNSTREVRNNVMVAPDKFGGVYRGVRLRRVPKKEFPEAIRLTLEYIESNYFKPLSLEMLADKASLSMFHFSRNFKKHVGISYSEYLGSLRVQRAKELLKETSMNVTEIGMLVGYNDLSNFERAFKKYVGLNPSNFRKGAQQASQG